MSAGAIAGIVIGGVVVLFILIVLLASIKIVNQTDKYVVERLGKYLDTGILVFIF